MPLHPVDLTLLCCAFAFLLLMGVSLQPRAPENAPTSPEKAKSAHALPSVRTHCQHPTDGRDINTMVFYHTLPTNARRESHARSQ